MGGCPSKSVHHAGVDPGSVSPCGNVEQYPSTGVASAYVTVNRDTLPGFFSTTHRGPRAVGRIARQESDKMTARVDGNCLTVGLVLRVGAHLETVAAYRWDVLLSAAGASYGHVVVTGDVHSFGCAAEQSHEAPSRLYARILTLPLPRRHLSTAQGLSTRAIAPIVGVIENTIRNDLSRGAEKYAPAPEPVEPADPGPTARPPMP